MSELLPLLVFPRHSDFFSPVGKRTSAPGNETLPPPPPPHVQLSSFRKLRVSTRALAQGRPRIQAKRSAFLRFRIFKLRVISRSCCQCLGLRSLQFGMQVALGLRPGSTMRSASG